MGRNKIFHHSIQQNAANILLKKKKKKHKSFIANAIAGVADFQKGKQRHWDRMEHERMQKHIRSEQSRKGENWQNIDLNGTHGRIAAWRWTSPLDRQRTPSRSSKLLRILCRSQTTPLSDLLLLLLLLHKSQVFRDPFPGCFRRSRKIKFWKERNKGGKRKKDHATNFSLLSISLFCYDCRRYMRSEASIFCHGIGGEIHIADGKESMDRR